MPAMLVLQVSKVYLYVYDNDHLLALMAKTNFRNIHENEKSVIPCRPTNPDVSVTFQANYYGRSTEDLTEKLGQRSMKYDPEVGLIMEKVDMKTHAFSQIICQANYGAVTQKYTFQVTMVPDQFYIPHIKPIGDWNHLKVVGETKTLSCQARFRESVPNVNLEWEFPNSSRYKLGTLNKTYPSKFEIVLSRSLTIDPLAIEDKNATLKCYMTKPGRKSGAGSFEVGHVREHDQEAHISNVEFLGNPEIVVQSDHIGKIF